MHSSLSFVICTEKGPLEQQSILLAMTLRTFGGRLASAPIFSFQPRRGFRISHSTRRAFNRLGVQHHEVHLNTAYPDYPLANKPLVAAYAEINIDSEILVLVDSDQMVLNEPSELCLPRGFDVGLRPVDVRNIGACGSDDPNFPYWEKLYQLLEATAVPFVHTVVDNIRVLAYWNTGLVAVARNNRLFSKWASNFDKVMNQGLAPVQGRYFVEQSVFAATVVAAGANVFHFSDGYNYPIQMHFKMQNARRIPLLRNMTTVHYHKLFAPLRLKHPLAEFLDAGGASAVIRRQLDESGVFPESKTRRIAKYFHRKLRRWIPAESSDSTVSGASERIVHSDPPRQLIRSDDWRLGPRQSQLHARHVHHAGD